MNGPTKREYDALRTLSGGLVESRGGLHPAGEGKIKSMLAAGWIEEVPEGAVGRQLGYRITEAGEAVLKAGCAPKPPRRPSRLQAMPPRIGAMPPRIRPLR
ncbi:hypothetical protein [Novosphingobium sp. TCA1]|uniref:hypothetical protein n=1 Tax=Novosphingobium sp. TCA1 TaxID=2682474 RepID=UPI00130A2502|nr:hypothetical protein [Novosphingobium sp. TCA1]GFE76155.1 hypothetical protein NTCA1_38040 [Novosphingobium sp. TCA1]